MDAFFAAVEQAAKPSVRGKPVIVGGLGPRGVVATASYEARRFGVRSAMPMAQARRLCPNAAFLEPRFGLYRQVSDTVMTLLHRLSPLVEPLSLDEAYVDLAAGASSQEPLDARRVGERLRQQIRSATGLTCSVGLAASKMLAKIASERAKPDGLVVIAPGSERDLLAPLPVRVLPGVGPATEQVLRRAGITTVGEAVAAGGDELVRLLGRAHGAALYAMAQGIDDRPVVSERHAKSVSVEDTFDEDVTDRVRLRLELDRLAERCARRLREAGRSGRTVVIKVRRFDFATLTRSETLRGPTDDPRVIRETAARLLQQVDTTAGVRLLGVGVSGLADYSQEDLFAQFPWAAGEVRRDDGADPAEPGGGGAGARPGEAAVGVGGARPGRTGDGRGGWRPGQDVRHAVYGPGWVQGSGLGRVTVRFETPGSAVGRVRTFAVDDPQLSRAEPLPLVPPAADGDGPVAGAPPGVPAAGEAPGDTDRDVGGPGG